MQLQRINAPGESPTTYTSLQREKTSCTTSSTLPCYEIDTNNSLYSGVITRTFYDQQGRVVETRTPGPTSGDDTVVITLYYDENNSVWKSEPFQVAAGSGWIDQRGARDVNGNLPGGTVTVSDALGRTIATQDLNYKSSQEPGLSCLWGSSQTYTSCVNYGLASPVGDSATYDWASSTDANNHVSESFVDANGQTRYVQVKSGVATGTVTVTKQTATQYNALGKPVSVMVTDELPQSGESAPTSTTTMTYDDTGRLLTAVDPDQGTLTHTYDQDNHMLSAVQTAGSNSRTTGYNYDLMGRMVCEQAGAAGVISWNGACSGGNTLFQNTYDMTTLGTQGTSDYPVGQLTQSVATTYYPGNTSATVTEQFQHDQRARLTNEQIQLGLPGSWNISAGLPTYQEAMSYNDANQVTTTSTTDGTSGYSFTSVYDPSNGVEQGLSNNSLSTANLATLSYNEYAQLASITLLNGVSSSPASVATEQYSYDADQRPTSLSASWLPGSGNTGQIVGQNRSYDNVSNVTSLATTFAAIPGQTGSGGAQTENFCYDEQNRLIWSGNSGTQPGAGNGTCGSGTLNNSLTGAGYSAPYTYTNLGQIWQGPLNHQGSQEQYLYCNSASPHKLTGVYPTGTICATMGSATAVYSASYDLRGNQTTRTTGGVTGTLSYDASNLLTEWNAGVNSQEFYLYDALGNRILKRSITGTGTTLAVYSFGLEENDYSGTGVLSTQTHYYSLASHLIGSSNGTTTTFYMTDGLDSVLTAFGQSAIEGEQVYGSFGASSYQSGILGLGVSGAITLGYAAYVLGPDMDAAAVDANAAVSAVADDPCEEGLSFAPTTLVATDHGEQAIGKLRAGDKVWSYNPQIKKMELEPIQKIWLNHDNDLVDLTLVATVKGAHGKTTQQKEVIHTNEKHPFLTKEKGFIPVSQLKPGIHVLEVNGHYGVVAKLVIVPGSKWMYNLTIAQDHTYAVGLEQWIVHNVNGPGCINNNELGNTADKTCRQNNAATGAASNVTNKQTGGPATSYSGGPGVTAIGTQAITKEPPYYNCCAETHLYADIVDGLKNGTMELEGDAGGVLRIVESKFDGGPPCPACNNNAQIFADELAKGEIEVSQVELYYRLRNGSVQLFDTYYPNSIGSRGGPR